MNERTLIISPAAKKHIKDAFRWYQQHAPLVGTKYLEQLETTFARIESNPLLYAVVYRTVRRAMLDRFPYGVFFVVEPQQITVISILHASRNPVSWPFRH
jgi:plasmid stabilization system protein ParE